MRARSSSHRGPWHGRCTAARVIARRALIAGLVGGLAMMPVGLAARAFGALVNVYGELVVRMMTGGLHPIALALEHLSVSWAMAVPLVVILRLADHRHAAALGVAYGATVWLLVNALVLPLAFDQPMPWVIGWSAIWGSLLVHLVFGATVALVSGVLARRQPLAPTAAVATTPAGIAGP